MVNVQLIYLFLNMKALLWHLTRFMTVAYFISGMNLKEIN